MPLQSCPWSITTGPDGALWFPLMCRGTIGRLTTSGSFSEFPASTPLRTANGITAGADGALWYVLNHGSIGRLALDGTATEIPVPGNQSGGAATGIVTGSDGAVWFTGRYGFGPLPPGSGPDTPGGFIGRVSGGAPTPPADTTPPSVTITSPAEGGSYTLGQIVTAT